MEENSHFTKFACGFTLIEVMIVVAVLGIVTAIAVPTTSFVKKRARENADSAALKTLNEAATRGRIESISNGVGAGLQGSDKDAALNWYISKQLVNGAPRPDISRLIYFTGKWDRDLFAGGQNAAQLAAMDAAINYMPPRQQLIDGLFSYMSIYPDGQGGYTPGYDADGDGDIDTDDTDMVAGWYGTSVDGILNATDDWLKQLAAYNYVGYLAEDGTWKSVRDIKGDALFHMDPTFLPSYLTRQDFSQMSYDEISNLPNAIYNANPASISAIQDKIVGDMASGVSYQNGEPLNTLLNMANGLAAGYASAEIAKAFDFSTVPTAGQYLNLGGNNSYPTYSLAQLQAAAGVGVSSSGAEGAIALSNVDLTGVKAILSVTNYSSDPANGNVNIQALNSAAEIKGHFWGMNLTGFKPKALGGASIVSSNLTGIDLTGVSLQNVYMQSNSGITTADLNKASSYKGFQYMAGWGTTLQGFNPSGKSMQGAQFGNPATNNQSYITTPAQFVAATGVTPGPGTQWIDGSYPWGP